jgi:spore germination cell wall hydrolase CwlJ-like protein
MIILIGVVITSTSLTIDSHQKVVEHRTDEVIHVIGEKLNEFVSADASDRNHKINVFMVLADFHTQIGDHDIQLDRIDSELNVALSQIVDWFYNSYISIVNEIAEEVNEDISEVQQYLADLSAGIDSISEYFSGDSLFSEDFDAGDIDTGDERLLRAEVFAELYSMYEMFIEDDFIPLRLDANEERINELTEVLSLSEDESIIDSERIAGLHDMISSLVEEFTDTDQSAATEAGNIISRFEAELSLQRIWFEEYYLSLIDEISNMVREDEYDEVTVQSQIEELRLVMQFIEDDAVLSLDVFLLINEQIEQLLGEYESDLAIIEERIKERDLAAAAAATAANRRNTATAPSSTGSRTGASTNNTSGSGSSSNNNTSGSGSGTNNSNSSGSSSGSMPARSNNNYPSISSDCREMLARLVRLEAPNEGADGKQAVAEVVLNRMVSSRWSHANTVEEVINDDKWGVQFTVRDRIWTDRGNPSSSDYAAVDRALGGSNVLSRAYVFFNTRPVTQNDVIWIGVHAFSK